MKRAVIFLIFAMCAPILFGQVHYTLPKVLILTTGADEGRGTVSDGIVVALQSLNQMGARVRLENRSALLRPQLLEKYDILLLPTIRGYHDLPRPNSLMYLSDIEMGHLTEWVKNGGTLVSDANLGRNTETGLDRILASGQLDASNWPLAKCFGVELKEVKTSNFTLVETDAKIWKYPILEPMVKDVYRAVPSSIGENVEIIGEWTNEKKSMPAMTINHFGQGDAVLLPDYAMLHPVGDGGLSTEAEIKTFYKLVIGLQTGGAKQIQLMPWKDAHTTAYCQTFDDGGNRPQYQRIIDFVQKNQLPTIFFVTPEVQPDIVQLLKQEKWISLQGHSYHHPDFRKLDYYETQSEFLLNKEYWNSQFVGFRFPYVSNSFWGMYWLDKLGFVYDSSIAANHFDYVRGSVVPYNLVIFKDDIFFTLDLLEVSQIYHSDWYHYQKILDKKKLYSKAEQVKDAQRFRDYLFRYYDEVVKPNQGVMVYLGHPMYSAISETTLQPLQEFITYLKGQNVWIASANEVAIWWKQLADLDIDVAENGDGITLTINTHGKSVKGLTFKLLRKPKEVLFAGALQQKELDGVSYLVLDVKGNQVAKIKF